MALKEDMKKKTAEFLSNSLEMFDDIFSRERSGIKTTRKPRPAAQEPSPPPSPEAPQIEGKRPKLAVGSKKPALTYKSSEKVKAGPKPKPKAKASSREGSRVLKTSLLLILLLVMAGFAANRFGIIDLSVIPDLLGLSPKPVVQAPIPKKRPAKPTEKPAFPAKPPEPEEKGSMASTVPTAPTPPVVSNEEKLVQLETPTTVAPVKEEKTRIEDKPASAPATDQPKPAEVAARRDSQPLPAQAEVLEKPSASKVAPLKPSGPQYPYSVYLGSFKTPEAVKKALSDYQEKGLSAYWARVDLRDKGVWYRFFTGYFRTKEEAAKYISERTIQGAEAWSTKYATLIGSYGSHQEAEDRKRTLLSAGFYPYVINDAQGRFLLYSGAFDRKAYAEKERDELSSKGIMSTVVER